MRDVRTREYLSEEELCIASGCSHTISIKPLLMVLASFKFNLCCLSQPHTFIHSLHVPMPAYPCAAVTHGRCSASATQRAALSALLMSTEHPEHREEEQLTTGWRGMGQTPAAGSSAAAQGLSGCGPQTPV